MTAHLDINLKRSTGNSFTAAVICTGLQTTTSLTWVGSIFATVLKFMLFGKKMYRLLAHFCYA